MALFKHRDRDLQAPLPLVDKRLAEWQAEDDHLARLVETARTFRGFAASGLDGGSPILLKAGERVYLIIRDAALIEPRSAGGHWVGRTQGVSVHVPGTKSMRYRIGVNRGTFVREAEKPTLIDAGTVVVTDKRIVFAGAKQAREWTWSKVIGLEHQEADWTAIPVSNRQKVSGVAYGAAAAHDVRYRIDLAEAVAAGTVDAFVAELEDDRAEHAMHRPGAPLPPPA